MMTYTGGKWMLIRRSNIIVLIIWIYSVSTAPSKPPTSTFFGATLPLPTRVFKARAILSVSQLAKSYNYIVGRKFSRGRLDIWEGGEVLREGKGSYYCWNEGRNQGGY